MARLVGDRDAEKADDVVRPHVGSKWKGYAAARRDARARARLAAQAEAEAVTPEQKDALLMRKLAGLGLPVTVVRGGGG